MKCFRLDKINAELIVESFNEVVGLPYIISDVDYTDTEELGAIREFYIDKGLIPANFQLSFELIESFHMDDGRVVSIILPHDFESLLFASRSIDSLETFMLLNIGLEEIGEFIKIVSDIIESRRFFIGYQLLLNEIKNISKLSKILLILDDCEGVIVLSESNSCTDIEKLYDIVTNKFECNGLRLKAKGTKNIPSIYWLDDVDMISKYFAERWCEKFELPN